MYVLLEVMAGSAGVAHCNAALRGIYVEPLVFSGFELYEASSSKTRYDLVHIDIKHDYFTRD